MLTPDEVATMLRLHGLGWGTRRIAAEAGCNRKITLGFSRRAYTQAFSHERQSAWMKGIEGAFRRFGELPSEVLLDNATALVKHHDPVTHEVD